MAGPISLSAAPSNNGAVWAESLTLTSVGFEPLLSRMRRRLASRMALVSGGKINFLSGDDVAVATSGSASVV